MASSSPDFFTVMCRSYGAFKDTAVCSHKDFYKSKALLIAQLAAQIASFGICLELSLEFRNELDVRDFLGIRFFVLYWCFYVEHKEYVGNFPVFVFLPRPSFTHRAQ